MPTGGENRTYRWFYREQGNETWLSLTDRTTNTWATTVNIDFAEINNVFTNETGVARIFEIVRLTDGEIPLANNTVRRDNEWSNILTLHVAPTLRSVNQLIVPDIAGFLPTETIRFCPNDRISAISHNNSAVENRWINADFGALPYNGSLYLFWETADWGTEQWLRHPSSDSIHFYNNHFNYEHFFEPESVITRSQHVRFTISDGCTSVSTGTVNLIVTNINTINGNDFIITPEGAEEGDDIQVEYIRSNVHWFSDHEGSNMIAENTRFLFLDNINSYAEVFLREHNNGCLGEIFEVP